MKKALILVDIQSDFAETNGTLYVPKGEEVVPIANRLTTSCCFDYIILTADSHPDNHKSFASNHPGHKVGDVIDLNGVKQYLWPSHCISYSEGAQFHKNLLTGRADMIFRKGMNPEIDSYSGFFDNAKNTTGLAEYLKAIRIDEVYTLGLATDYCIKYTAIDSVKVGFKTYLIEDGCRAVNISPDDGKNAIEEMRTAGVIIEKSGDNLVKLWKAK